MDVTTLTSECDEIFFEVYASLYVPTRDVQYCAFICYPRQQTRLSTARKASTWPEVTAEANSHQGLATAMWHLITSLVNYLEQSEVYIQMNSEPENC